MKKIIKNSILTVFAIAGLFYCSREIPLLNFGLNDSYHTERMKALHLKPRFERYSLSLDYDKQHR
jgi:hypothetical protein